MKVSGYKNIRVVVSASGQSGVIATDVVVGVKTAIRRFNKDWIVTAEFDVKSRQNAETYRKQVVKALSAHSGEINQLVDKVNAGEDWYAQNLIATVDRAEMCHSGGDTYSFVLHS